jgi:hypothetical protein
VPTATEATTIIKETTTVGEAASSTSKPKGVSAKGKKAPKEQQQGVTKVTKPKQSGHGKSKELGQN